MPQTPTSLDEIRGIFRSEGSAPKKILITPSGGNPQARKHWDDTIAHAKGFVDPILRALLDEEQFRQLQGTHGDGRAQFWGARPTHDKKMEIIQSGDIAIFSGGGKVTAVARVGVIFKNANFANALWPPKEGEHSWHNVFSLSNIVFTAIRHAELNQILGYKASNHYQSLIVPDEAKVTKLIALLT